MKPQRDVLVELAERVETGPDRELDTVIWLAVTPGATRKKTIVPANATRAGWTIDETRRADGRLIVVPSYTGSLDAAMTLVPEGCFALIDTSGAHARLCRWLGDLGFTGLAATPALALTAASLKARALAGGRNG